MWILGGTNGTRSMNDVWFSVDGSSWTLATSAAQWSPRFGHASVVHDNRMWVIGPGDVWWSRNGSSWTLAIDSPPWAEVFPNTGGRQGHTCVSTGGRIWLMGGDFSVLLPKMNDVWSSRDGVNWELATAHADWSIRYDHASVVFHDRIWILGGIENGSKSTPGRPMNDIWFSGPFTAAGRWVGYP
jgi:hypothetical protein